MLAKSSELEAALKAAGVRVQQVGIQRSIDLGVAVCVRLDSAVLEAALQVASAPVLLVSMA